MSDNRIYASETPLEKVFSSDYVFTIPPYQRPYSWTNEEAGELLSDLLQAMGADRDSTIDELNPYFLGSIVLVKERDKPDAEILDGQQRLTTMTILFSAIRSFVSRPFADDISLCIYEKGRPALGTQDRFRLSTRNKDNRFLIEYVQRENGIGSLRGKKDVLIESQKNIRDNALYYLDVLEKHDPRDLERFFSFILKKCYVVVVATEDKESAFRIFAVMNDRGKDLTTSDILKAEIIGQIEEEEQPEYTQKWEDAEDETGRDNFDTLFGHIRMIYARTKSRQTIIKDFRAIVRPTDAPKGFIDNILIPYKKAYSVLRSANYQSSEKAEQVNEMIRWLRMVNNIDWEPPAISYIAKNGHDPEKLLRFLTDLERLATGLMIYRANVNERIERYGRLLKEMESDTDLFSGSSALQLTDTEQTAITNSLNGVIYGVKQLHLPVLLRLNDALSSTKVRYEGKTLSVEHVLPQTPYEKSEWTKWWPEKEIRESYVNRLGNIVLLEGNKNSSAGNSEFDSKKTTYLTKNGVTPFAITQTVYHEKEWTPEVVQERQERYVRILCKTWRLSSSFPSILKTGGATLEYRHEEEAWHDVTKKQCLYLYNGEECVGPGKWDRKRVVCILSHGSSGAIKDAIKKESFFNSVEKCIVVRPCYAYLSTSVEYDAESGYWATDDEKHAVYLVNSGVWVDPSIWEEGDLLVDSCDPEGVIAAIGAEEPFMHKKNAFTFPRRVEIDDDSLDYSDDKDCWVSAKTGAVIRLLSKGKELEYFLAPFDQIQVRCKNSAQARQEIVRSNFFGYLLQGEGRKLTIEEPE